MSAGSAIAPRPQAAAPGPKGAYPPLSAASAGQPQGRRSLPALTLRNKVSALALFALTLSAFPAAQAQAQNVGTGTIREDVTFGADNERLVRDATLPAGGTRFIARSFSRHNPTSGSSVGVTGNIGFFAVNTNGRWQFELNPRRDQFALVKALSDGESLNVQYRVSYNTVSGPRGNGFVSITIQGVSEPVTGRRTFSFNEDQNNNGSNSQVSGVLNWQFGDVIRNANSAGQVRVANNNNPSGEFGIWTPTPGGIEGAYGRFFMDTSRGNWRYIFFTNRDAVQNLQADAAPADRFSIAPYTDAFATVEFVFTINGRNDDPVVTMARADQSMVRPGEVVQLSGAATDRDFGEQGTLAYAWGVTPAVGTFADATDPNTTWTAPAIIHEEDYVLTLRAHDVSGGSASRSVRVNGNSVPQFNTRYTPPAYTFRAGNRVNSNTAELPLARFGDAPLQYRLTPALPPGLALDSINDIFGTPQRQLDTRTYTWTVTDANGDSDTIEFTITVVTLGSSRPADGLFYLDDPDSDFYGQVSEVAGDRVAAGRVSYRNAAGQDARGGVANETVAGRYGTLSITDPGGDVPRWSYRVDHINADVLNLPAGVRLRETLDPACQASPRSGDPDLCYTINIDIIGANQPPNNVQAQVFNPQSGNFGGSVSAAQGSILQLRGRAQDRDTGEADTLTYIWSVNPTTVGGTFADRHDPDTTYTVGTRGAGATYTLSLLVRDQSGGSASDTLTVTGAAAPVALTGDLTAAIDADGDTAFGTVSHPLRDSRQQGVYGSFVSSANTWEYNLNSRSGIVRALPLGRLVRDRFIAYPAQLNIRGAPVIVTITGVNDPPMADTQRDGLRVAAGETISVDGGVSLDPDDGETETLTYAWSAVPDTAGSFADRSARLVRWTAPNPRPAAGFIALRLTVTDVHGASDNIIANINIDPAIPAITGDFAGAVTENDATNTATGTLQYINPPATGGTDFSVPSPTGRYGSLAITTAGVWTYTLNNADSDTQALLPRQMVTDTISVRAGTGVDATDADVTIAITGANDLPVAQITAPATNLTRSSGAVVTLTATATDVDAHEQPLRFLWFTEPTGQGVFRNPTALSTTWTAPSYTAMTDVDVVFRVTDPTGARSDDPDGGRRASRTVTITPATAATGGNTIVATARISENTDFGNDNQRITGMFTSADPAQRYEGRPLIRRATVDGGSTGDFGFFGYNNAGVWTFELDPRNARFREVHELRQGETLALDYPVLARFSEARVGVARIIIEGRAEPVTGSRNPSIGEDETNSDGRNVRRGGQLNWNLGGSLRVDGGQVANNGNPSGQSGIWTPGTMTGAYGQFEMEDSRGNWNYIFFNGDARTQALQAGDAPVDQFTIAPYTDLYENVVFRFTINGANDPPVLTAARADRVIVRPGEVVQLSGAATDVDNNEQRSLVYTWLASPTAGTFADRNDPNTTWTAPDPLVEDFYTLSLRVRDQNGAADTISVRINGDTTPQFRTRFTPMAYTFQANRFIDGRTAPLPAATGGDGALSYFITPALPPGIMFDSGARELGGRPLARQDTSGETDTFTYRVVDANGDTDTIQFTITIVPDFASPPAQPSRYIGGTLTGRVRDVSGERSVRGTARLLLPNGGANGGGFPSNQDQDGVYGTLEVRGANWRYQLERSRDVTVNLPGGVRAFETFTIAASDRDLYPDATLIIEVIGTNEAPTASAAVVAGVSAAARAGEPIQVVGTGADADTGDAAALSYAWSVTPTALGGSFSDRTASETFYFVGSRGPGATYTLTLRVTDTSGASDTGSFMVRQESEEGSRLTGDLSVRTGEDDGLVVSGIVSHALNAVNVAGTGGILRVNAGNNRWFYNLTVDVTQALSENQEIVNIFTLTPTDASVAPANLSIAVVGANDAPVVRIDAPSGAPRVVAGTVIALDATATDVDADDQMLYQWRADPDLGTFADATALDTTWTAPATPAEVTLSLTVSDGVTGPDGNLVSGRLSDTAQVVIGVTESTDVEPTLPEFADQTYRRGVAVSVTLPAAGGGNGALSYALSPVPPGMTFNADTRVLSGSPTFLTAAGNPNEHTYSVTDSPVAPATSGDTVEDVFVITITVDPGPPSFAGISVDNQSFIVGRPVPGNLVLPAAADGAPPLSYAFFRTAGGVDALPPGLSFNAATRSLSGTPAEALTRSAFTYRVTDASDRRAMIENILVEIATIGFDETIPDQTYGVNVSLATGAGPGALPYVLLPAAVGSSPPFRYTLLDLPPGLNFDQTTRRLSGTPTEALDSELFVYTATDSDNTAAALQFSITIGAPVPYFSPIVELAFPAGETNLTYPAGEDITPLELPSALGDDGPLTYTLSLNSDGSGGLPVGLSFDGSTFLLTGRPTTGQVLTLYFYVATDSDGDRSNPLTVNIGITVPGDDMPAFADGATIDDQVYTASNAISTLVLPQASGGDGALAYTLTVAADGGDVPAGLSFNATAQTLSGTPSEAQTATEYAYTVTDSDATDPDSVTLNFDITVLAASAVTVSGDTTGDIVEDGGDTDTGTLTVSNSDPAGSTEVVAQTDADGMYGTFTILANGAWTYTLNNAAAATNALAAGAEVMDTFTVTAAADPAAIVVITITVTGANDAPSVTISAPADDTDVAFGTALTLTATGEDVDSGTTLSYAWSANPDVGSFADAAVASTTWTAPGSGTDPVTLTLTVTDDATPPLSGTDAVTVNPTAVSVTFDGSIEGGVIEDGGDTDTGTLTVSNSDPAGSTEVVAQTDADGMYGTFTILANGAWTYTLNNAAAATNALAAGAEVMDTFTVTAAADPAAIVVITITVTGANDAPSVTISAPADDTDVEFGTALTLTATGEDPDTGTTLSYAWSANPDVGSFADAAVASTTWTAPGSGTAPVTLTLTVTDDDATTPLTGTDAVTVNPTAVSVTFDGIIEGGVIEDASTNNIGGTLIITTTSTNKNVVAQTETDQPGTYGSFSILARGVWFYTLNNADPDTNALAVGDTVTDTFTVAAAANPAATQIVTVTITGANDAPLANAGTDQAVALSATVTLDGSASADPDTGADPANADAIDSYAWTQDSGTDVTLSDAAVVRPTFTAPNSEGDLVFSLVVNDGDLNSAPATVTITVTDAPAASISATTPTMLTEDTLDGATLTVTLANTTYVASLPVDSITLNTAATTAGVTATAVRDSDTEATLTLAFDRASSDFDTNLGITVTVAAAAHANAGDLLTASVTVEAIDESSVATLSGLALSGGAALNETFAPATLTYTADVADTVTDTVTDIMVTPTATDDGATITVNGNAVASGAASTAIALTADGATPITVEVTAEDGTTTQTYTLTVTRAALALGFGGETITPQTYTVNTAITDLTLPVATGGTAPYSYALSDVPSGLAFDADTRVLSGVPDAVLAATTYTYTATDAAPAAVTLDLVITVGAEAASSDATLSGLTLSGGATLNPVFAPATLTYAADVANDVATLTVTPTATDAGATIAVNGTTVTSGAASTAIALTAGAATDIAVLVTAEDGTTTQTYNLAVTRAAVAVPSLPNTAFTVAENAAANTSVGTPLVPANFPSGTQIWAIVSGNTGNDFSIVEDTGQLSVAADDAINFEDTASYTLMVSLTIGTAMAQATVTLTVSDENEPPLAPAAPTVTAAAVSLNVDWTAPDNNGPAITSYDVQFRTGVDAFTPASPGPGAATSLTITGLTASTLYEVQVRAVNAEGNGAYSASGSGTPLAASAPTASITTTVPGTLTEANLNGAMLTVTLSNATYVGTLTASQFTLTGAPGGAMISVESVAGSGTQAVLVLAYPEAGADLDSDLNLSVVVDAAAHTGTNPLTTAPVTVADNAAPVITNPGSQTYVRNAPITALMITVTDADGDAAGDPPVVMLMNLPNGLLFDGDQVTGTPTGAPGDTEVTITAVDGVNDMVTDTFTITVNAPSAALTFGAATIPAQTYTMGSAITDLTLPTATGGTGTLSYSLSGMPSGLAFDAGTRVLSGTPNAAQAATTYTYTASDAATSPVMVMLTFTIEVTPALSFSVATIPAQTYIMGSAITDLTLPVATGGTGTLSYALSGMPSGLGFNATTRVLSGTPDTVQAATTYIYTASDADSATVTLNLVITVVAPATPIISGTLSGTLVEDAPTTMATGMLTISNPGSGATTFTPQTNALGIYGGFSIEAGGGWSYMLNNSATATDALAAGVLVADTFEVRAVNAAIAPATVTISITGANDAPTATAGAAPTTVASGGTVALTGGGVDPDTGATLVFQWSAAGNAGTFTNANMASASWDAPRLDSTTSIVITLTVSDGTASASATVSIEVMGNQPSVISGDLTGAASVAVPTATGTLTSSDSDGPDNSFTAATGIAGTFGTLSITDAGAWSYTLDLTDDDTIALAAAQTADDVLTISAADGTEATLTITVTGANDPPLADAGGDQRQGQGATVTLDGSASSDPDSGASLSHAWAQSSGTPTVTLSGQATATATFTAPELPPGVDSLQLGFTLTVTDGTVTVSDTVSITITNEPSVVGGDLSGRVSENAPTASGMLTSRDPDGPDNMFMAADDLAGTYGTLDIAATGAWRYELDLTDEDTMALLAAGQTGEDAIMISTADGTAATITIRVGQREEARSEAMEMTLGTFGRSFTSSAVEVLGERFSSGAGGSQLTFGGRTLSLESLTNGQAAVDAGDEPNNQPVPAAAGGQQTSVGALFAGSAFQLSLNEGDDAGVGATTLWARGAVGNYEGEPEDGFQLDGDIVSGYLGLDYRASRRMLVGVAVSHSRGDADFSSADIADGEVETDLTSILPYVQWQARPGLSVWGLVGYGEGESEITDSGESRKTDVEMKTAALGARGKLWSGGRADVALKASALTVEIESDSEQNLSSVSTSAHRLRMALAGNRHGAASARGGRFGQRFELGLRWDLGDVETGAGADLGAGVEYANPRSGTRLRLDGHYLLVHEETDFEEWEVSAEVGITPSLWGRGVTFALQPGWDSAGARQRMVMDFTNVLGPAWRGDGLKLELYGEHAEDHEFGLEGSVRY